MKMSFWSHCQGLVVRLRQGRTEGSRRFRRSPLRLVERLEARTLLSSTPALVADIAPGAAASSPTNVVAIGSTVYFTANDGVHGEQLWKSNGTAASTTMITDSSNPYIEDLTNVHGTLFFVMGGVSPTLWKSDGTTAGTVMVSTFGASYPAADYPGALTDVNGTLFFENYISATEQTNLWKSDGTDAGTAVVSSAANDVRGLTNVNGTLFFAANDGAHGQELWKSDGTAAGTVLVKDIFAGASSSNPTDLTNVKGTLFFLATDGHGEELWKSDGTAAGTVMVSSLGGTLAYPTGELDIGSLTDVNGTLFLLNRVSSTDQLWRSDGTDSGTVMLGAFTTVQQLTSVNGTLFFEGNDGTHGTELWKSDGTVAGTVVVKGNFVAYASYSYGGPRLGPYLLDLTNANGTLYFTGCDGIHGRELWKSDGTAAGTVMVADINPGRAGSYPSYLTNANGTLFFSANDGVHGSELWALNTAPGPSLGISGFPATTTAGAAGSFTVTAENADGTTDTGYLGTVQFSSTDPQATIVDPATGKSVALQGFTYTFAATDGGVHTFSTTLKTAGTQSITAADTMTVDMAGTDGSITVKPATATMMTVAGFPSTTTAGVAGNITVTLKDQYGNIAAGYTGTVRFTSSDGKALLPASYTFTAADAGTHIFSATLKTAGTQSITARDALSSALTAGDGGITVNAAAASKFIVSAPSTVSAGVHFSLTLTVEDAYGNIVTGYTGTVHFTSSDRTATLLANYTFTASDKGVHTFVGLVLRKRGKQTIAITDTLNRLLTASVIENVG
jgi:ELWxxDGT repeat protein